MGLIGAHWDPLGSAHPSLDLPGSRKCRGETGACVQRASAHVAAAGTTALDAGDGEQVDAPVDMPRSAQARPLKRSEARGGEKEGGCRIGAGDGWGRMRYEQAL